MEESGANDARGGLRVEVMRGGRIESRHSVDVTVVGADGEPIMRAGRPAGPVFARSTVKPFQALPLVADGVADRFGLTDEELALCCGSHSGEPRHVEVARSILKRVGLGEDELACGPHRPFDSEAARAIYRAGREPGRVHNNCSGKHAGMLALAVGNGWAVDGYHEAGHPVQERVLDEVARWSGMAREEIHTGVDGCGVVTFALPLGVLALAFARWSRAAAERGSASGRLLAAMADHPFMVAGSGRLCTEIIERTGGRIIAKTGAEGVYAAVATDRHWGIALKARDGARRASEVALLGTLTSLGLIGPAERSGLSDRIRPAIRNTRGEVVGSVRSRLGHARVREPGAESAAE